MDYVGLVLLFVLASALIHTDNTALENATSIYLPKSLQNLSFSPGEQLQRYKRQQPKINCSKGEFQCTNRKCISAGLKCDGRKDCSDGSDETALQCSKNTCPSYLYRCAYGACVDETARCNKVQDCPDNSDEIGCPGSTPVTSKPSSCRKSEYACKDGTCIAREKLCDGKADCKDVSDETIAACSKSKCPSYLFRCSYGACIDEDLKCNHFSNCVDSSDEWISLCGAGFVDPNAEVVTETTRAPVTVKPTVPSVPIDPDANEQCSIPELPEGGSYKLLGSTQKAEPDIKVAPETTLEYKCKKNHALEGPAIIKCQQDGTWNSDIPMCRKMCTYTQSVTLDSTCSFNDKTISCSGLLKHNTKVNSKCKAKHFSRYPLRRQTCVDGSWDNSNERCEPDCGEEPGAGVGLILGGSKAKNGTFPWHVGIYSNLIDGTFQQVCGGTILRSNIIVSAGHCFYNDQTGSLFLPFSYLVAAGKFWRDFDSEEDKKNSYFQVIAVKKIIVPDQYGGNNQQHQSDIALLELMQPLNFSQFVLPACIDMLDDNFDKQQLAQGNMGKAAGWGVIEEGGPASDYLKSVELPVIHYNECRNKLPESFRRYLTNDKFCAGYLNGTSVCSGDSGGGMVFSNRDKGAIRWFLRGIVSVGVPSNREGVATCRNDTYAAFTRVFNHKDWILEMLNNYS